MYARRARGPSIFQCAAAFAESSARCARFASTSAAFLASRLFRRAASFAFLEPGRALVDEEGERDTNDKVWYSTGLEPFSSSTLSSHPQHSTRSERARTEDHLRTAKRRSEPLSTLTAQNNTNNMTIRERRIRTVKVNDRGQLVIPEDVREDLHIGVNTTLVLLQRGDEIVLRKEADVLDDLEGGWRDIARHSLARAWDAEDDVWDAHYKAEAA